MRTWAETLGEHLIACANPDRARNVLLQSLRQDFSAEYSDRRELLGAVLQHTMRREASASAESIRVWIGSVVLVVRAEIMRG